MAGHGTPGGPGGRIAGLPNKRTQQLQIYVDTEGKGVSPAKVLLSEMWHHYSLAANAMSITGPARDLAAIDKHLRNAAKAAERAAPYVHAKLSTVVVQGDEYGGPVRTNTTISGGVGVAALTAAELDALSTSELARLYRETIGESGLPAEEPEGDTAGTSGVPAK